MLLAVAVGITGTAAAQTTTASVNGVVTDQAGAVITGVQRWDRPAWGPMGQTWGKEGAVRLWQAITAGWPGWEWRGQACLW